MKCKCDLRARLVGDGCEFCNPEITLDLMRNEIIELKAELEEARSVIDFYGDDASYFACYDEKGQSQICISGSDILCPNFSMQQSGGKRARAFNEKYKRGKPC